MLHTVNKPASPRVAPLSITKTVLPTTKTFEIEIGVTNKKQVSAEATSYCATPVTEEAVKASDAAKPPRKRNKKPRIEVQPIPLENLKWLTIAQTSLRYPAFSQKALRHLVASAEAYHRYPKAGLKSNGFIHCICRPAGQRKIVIEAEKFEQWLQSFSVAAK
ncbi:MAG: hypothetical protein IPJ12_05935 [Betaproteobacteria bacterium]|nr:hypothetical protein [Betaproteobacteria bacterium]